MKRKIISLIMALVFCFTMFCITACNSNGSGNGGSGIDKTEESDKKDDAENKDKDKDETENKPDNSGSTDKDEDDGDGSSQLTVTGITLDKTTFNLETGKKKTLVATVTLKMGDVELTVSSDAQSSGINVKINWESSKTSVATVADGVVTAKEEGEAIITAKAGGKRATCKVTVTEEKKNSVINTTLKDIRFNPEQYLEKKIVVEGLVVAQFNNSVYIEKKFYDIEGYGQGICIGIPVYYGFIHSDELLEILSVGNMVKVVGILTYFEGNGNYQISGVSYDSFNPDESCQLIGEVGISGAYTEINPSDLASASLKVSADIEKTDNDGVTHSEKVSLTYAEALLGTSVTVKNLLVTSIYTSNNGGSNDGAMTIRCTAEDGTEITVRTEVLYGTDGTVITADRYMGKTITVKGIVERYSNTYQIRCHLADYITVL